jgi:transcriptional regulator NrdR family protein
MVDDNEKESIGLECKNCGCRHFYVDGTRQAKNQIIRYRICRNCGKRHTSIERIVSSEK